MVYLQPDTFIYRARGHLLHIDRNSEASITQIRIEAPPVNSGTPAAFEVGNVQPVGTYLPVSKRPERIGWQAPRWGPGSR